MNLNADIVIVGSGVGGGTLQAPSREAARKF